MSSSSAPICRYLGHADYESVLQAMQRFTEQRDSGQADEIWIVEHDPVYTLGRAGNRANLLNVENIPVVQVDRGGDVTYHGPGQLVVYLLADIKRLDMSVRQVVNAIEASIVDYLASLGIESQARADAPGVYVEGRKIASLGLRVRRGCCYHGLAMNIDMDMSPWAGINACNLGVPITQISELLDNAPTFSEAAQAVSNTLAKKLGYSELINTDSNLFYE